MQEEKLYLAAIGKPDYKGTHDSDFQSEIKMLDEEIKQRQEKKKWLEYFATIEETKAVSFTKVIDITLAQNWYEANHTGEDYSIKEERYIFQIKTDKDSFPVLIEYIGYEHHIDKWIYRIYAPKMKRDLMVKVEEAIFNHFDNVKHEKMKTTFLHQYKTSEDAIENVCETKTCLNCYSKYVSLTPFEDYQFCFEKGKKYSLIFNKNGIWVRDENKKFCWIDKEKAKQHFEM